MAHDEVELIDFRKTLKPYSIGCDPRATPTDTICLLSTEHSKQNPITDITMTEKAISPQHSLGCSYSYITVCLQVHPISQEYDQAGQQQYGVGVHREGLSRAAELLPVQAKAL